MDLYQEWQEKIKNISTNNFSISIGELVTRYSQEQKRIVINPAYQRHYRWTNEQKSNFIESLLLGYPIPPIFMYRDTVHGFWEVIDGLQRLATIYEFIGVLEESFPRKEKLKKLKRTSIFRTLEDKTWEDFKKSNLDFILETQTLQVTVLDNKSDIENKYEIFRRLNSSSTVLSAQEIRNATLYESAPAVYEHIEKQIKRLDFTFLSAQDFIERKDMELFLEFLLLSNLLKNQYQDNDAANFSEALNKFSLSLDSEELEEGFIRFSKFINDCGKCQFKYTKDEKPQGAFINAYFEIISSLYILSEDGKVEDEEIKEILSKKYSEWQTEIGVNNPSALNRMRMAMKYAKDYRNVR
ncbi:MAG: DUF262 domain-containing protein [Cetobacterium sp.]